jgi:hypothetical protein
LNKIHLIYNSKDKEVFHLARWRENYSIDLSMITQDPEGDDITTALHIFNRFSRSQYRPVFLHYGLRIPLTRSVPKHRSNFARADWDRFARDLDYVMTDSVQPNVTFPVVIKISIFQDVTINVTSSTKGSILFMKKHQLCISLRS